MIGEAIGDGPVWICIDEVTDVLEKLVEKLILFMA